MTPANHYAMIYIVFFVTCVNVAITYADTCGEHCNVCVIPTDILMRNVNYLSGYVKREVQSVYRWIEACIWSIYDPP